MRGGFVDAVAKEAGHHARAPCKADVGIAHFVHPLQSDGKHENALNELVKGFPEASDPAACPVHMDITESEGQPRAEMTAQESLECGAFKADMVINQSLAPPDDPQIFLFGRAEKQGIRAANVADFFVKAQSRLTDGFDKHQAVIGGTVAQSGAVDKAATVKKTAFGDPFGGFLGDDGLNCAKNHVGGGSFVNGYEIVQPFLIRCCVVVDPCDGFAGIRQAIEDAVAGDGNALFWLENVGDFKSMAQRGRVAHRAGTTRTGRIDHNDADLWGWSPRIFAFARAFVLAERLRGNSVEQAFQLVRTLKGDNPDSDILHVCFVSCCALCRARPILYQLFLRVSEEISEILSRVICYADYAEKDKEEKGKSVSGMSVRCRVLFLVANLPVPVDRRVWQEARILARAGYAVTVICPKGKGFHAAFEESEGIRIHRFPVLFEARGGVGFMLEYALLMFWTFYLSLRVVVTRGVDVVHACNPPDLFFLIGLLFRLFGVRFVYDQHDLCPELCEVKFGKGPAFRIALWLEACSYHFAHRVIVTNESYAAIAEKRATIAPDRLFIVRNTPDPERFRCLLSPERSPVFVIGFAGVMGEQDGVARLVDAVEILVREKGLGAEDFRLDLVGDGTERPRLEARVVEKNIGAVVRFHGFLAGDDFLRVVAGFSAGVAPDAKNAYSDAITMNKTLEYMALGVPVVLSPLAQSCRDVGAAGVVIAEDTPRGLAESLFCLMRDPARLEVLRDAARVRSRDFTFGEVQKNLLSAYAGLCRDVAREPCGNSRE